MRFRMFGYLRDIIEHKKATDCIPVALLRQPTTEGMVALVADSPMNPEMVWAQRADQ